MKPLNLNHLSIRNKLALAMLFVVILAILVIGTVGFYTGQQTIRQTVSEQLKAVRFAKASHIDSYLKQVRDEALFVASDPTVTQALDSFTDAYSSAGAASKSPAEVEANRIALLSFIKGRFLNIYTNEFGKNAKAEDLLPSSEAGLAIQAHLFGGRSPQTISSFTEADAKYSKFFERIIKRLGFYDLKLIDTATGNIVYTYRKSPDIATNLVFGPYRDTNLANVYRKISDVKARNVAMFADYQRYVPSGGQPVSFVASRILKDGKLVGILVLQLSVEEIDRVMTSNKNWESDGFGSTGEAYLVGPDMTLRSNVRPWLEQNQDYLVSLQDNGILDGQAKRMLSEKSSILIQDVRTDAVKRAIKGEQGTDVTTNYLGKEVVSSYGPLQSFDLDWVIIAEQQSSEAYAPMRSFQLQIAISALALILLSISLAVALSRRLTEPLEQLMNVAKSYGAGNTDIRVPVKTTDEVGELGLTMNQMMDDLNEVNDASHSIRRNIVHDLKTPLTVIKGMTETLMEPEVANNPELRQELLGTVVEESDRLLDDLKDILEPIDSHWAPNFETFDISLLISQVAKAEEHTERSDKHEIVVEGIDQPVIVRADRRKIRRVIENLLSNAVKYSPGEGKKVVLSLNTKAESAVVEVQDFGMGMTPEQLEIVMKDGGRVVDRNLGIEGTGIGIESCRMVMQRHGGKLEAESKPGTGSKFRMILPL